MKSILGKRSSSRDDSVDSSEDSIKDDDTQGSIYSIDVGENKKRSSKPFAASFRCYSCSRSYLKTVYHNPWFVNVREKCPHCNNEQMPTLDINLPINARELDPNVESFYNVVKDEEFLDLTAVDDCDDFSLELTEPVIRLLFEDYFKDDISKVRLSTQREGQSLPDVVNLRLLSLVVHAARCTRTYHSNVKQTMLCRNTKVLLLHLLRCCRITDCQFPHCIGCRSVVSYLSAFPVEAVFPAPGGVILPPTSSTTSTSTNTMPIAP